MVELIRSEEGVSEEEVRKAIEVLVESENVEVPDSVLAIRRSLSQ